jgi:hypothetical protein
LRKEYFEAGRLRNRSVSQAPDAVVELAADLRGHRRHELLDLHGCLCALTDDAASHVLEDLDEGDTVRVDPLLAGLMNTKEEGASSDAGQPQL